MIQSSHQSSGDVGSIIDANGLRFHCLEWGAAESPPMLLLHGMHGYAAVWTAFARAFATSYRVIALDQRGHGGSGWSEQHDYSADAMVADAGAVLDELGLRTVTLAGFSMGGRNAYLYASRCPERVSRLVIMDVGPAMGRRFPMPGPGEPFQDPKPETFDSPEQAVDFMVSQNPRPIRSYFAEIVPSGLKRTPDGRWTWKWDPGIGDPRRYRTQWMQSAWDEYRRIRCPTLVLRGAESDVLDSEVAERMVRELAHAKLVTVPAAGHNILDDNLEFVIANVRRFLSSFS